MTLAGTTWEGLIVLLLFSSLADVRSPREDLVRWTIGDCHPSKTFLFVPPNPNVPHVLPSGETVNILQYFEPFQSATSSSRNTQFCEPIGHNRAAALDHLPTYLTTTILLKLTSLPAELALSTHQSSLQRHHLGGRYPRGVVAADRRHDHSHCRRGRERWRPEDGQVRQLQECPD